MTFEGEAGWAKTETILALATALREKKIAGMIECVPSLSSLTVTFDPLKLDRDFIVSEAAEVYRHMPPSRSAARVWTLPVVYGGTAGPDLGFVAEKARFSEEETVSLHTSVEYTVYTLGFLPGFAYLGDVPDALRLPRRSSPRAAVPAGSVAIAANMTAIYPLESPGGWNIVGRTSVPLWDFARMQEPLLKPGDKVRFQAVPVAEQEAVAARVAQGWLPQPESRS
jgi:KipI family sensor histidine kinase inhibitor